jgi:lipoate-protein ligase A
LNAQKGIIHCPALFLEGKKFSGNAQSRKKGFLLQHGTILLRVNPELMYSVLKAPNNISTSKMVRSVYAKVTGLKEYFNKWSEKEFLNSLKIGFEKVLGIKLIEGYYSNNELKMARFLVKNKYRNENWTEKYE